MTTKRALYGTAAIVFAIMVAGGLLVLAIVRGDGVRTPVRAVLREADAMDSRFLAGRIDGAAYHPLERTAHSSTRADDPPSRLRLRSAAALTLRRQTAAKDTVGRHASGLAHLFSGNVDEAIRVLRDAAERPGASAGIWNDLAVATQQRATVENDPRESAYALIAANRALELDPELAPALYNRVLALDGVGLEFAARHAAQKYLAVDAGSEWSREIREQLKRWEAPTLAAQWKAATTELERATERGDDRAVAAIVKRFPQQSRAWGEGEFLGRWSDAVLAIRTDEARRWLSAAQSIGHALVETNGAGELRAIVDHLQAHEAPETIAKAFQTYRTGRKSLDRRNAGESVVQLREASLAFERAGSPLALFATHYLAIALLDAHQVEESARVLSHIDASLKPDYHALRAQCDWHRANLLARQGRLYEAHSAAQRSLAEFERLREDLHRTRMLSGAASTSSRLGRTQEAWRLRNAALRAATRVGDVRALEVTLNSTIRQAIREREWPIAHALLDAQIERGISTPRLRVDAFLWRAFVAARMRGHGSAEDMRAALRAAEGVEDRNLRDDALADVHFAEAMISRSTNPGRAIELLDEVIAWRERNGGADLPIAYVERARAHRALGDIDLAGADLARATHIIESQREEIARDDIRDAFFGSSEDAYEEQIDVMLDRRDPGGALAASERMRARVVLDRLMGRPVDGAAIHDVSAIQHRIPDGVQLVHLTVLAQRTLVVSIDRLSWGAATVNIGRTEIERLRNVFLDAIAGADETTMRSSGRRLYEILLSQVSTRDGEVLVLVPDETLAEIPFAALLNPQGRFLIEETAITVAPSAAAFVHWSQDRRELSPRHDRAVIVGDPAFDGRLFPDLPRLASATDEVRILSKLLPRSHALTGGEATRARFLDHARGSTIVHIAAHAMTNRTNPSASFIVLASSENEPGPLYHRDIALGDFRAAQLVVLAGCRTAAASNAPGSVRSLAMAFIAGGSRTVLGSLWDIEDAATKEMSVAFYRHLANEPRPAAALRLAQLDMLRSSDVGNRAVRIWSALQMYGSGF